MVLAPSEGAGRLLGKRIRRRLFWIFLFFGIGTGATFYYREQVFAFLLAPAGGELSPFDGLPVYNSPVAMMSATISLAMRGGFTFALPVIVVSIYTLVRPVLPEKQRHFIIVFAPIAFFLFLAGNAFVYYVMLPTGLGFLLNFGEGIAVPLILISDYVDLLSALMLWVGIVFEIPLVMYLLSRMHLVSYQRFRKWRMFVPVFALILGAILTPTFDAVNQLLLAVPIYVLYEVGLFVSWLAWTERGDYLRLKTLWRRVLRPLWRAVVWFWNIPDRIAGWVYEQAMRLLRR
jgi:sec-independent protein translocase protein TatC